MTFVVKGENGAFQATWNGKPVALDRECTDGKGQDCRFHKPITGDKGLNTFKLLFKPFRNRSEESLLQSGAKTTGAALLKSFDAMKEKSKSRSWAKAKAKAKSKAKASVQGRRRRRRHRHVTPAPTRPPTYSASFGAKAAIKYFWITNVPIQFASCEDHTSCLAEMVDSPEWTKEAQDLRNSVRLQWDCVNGQVTGRHNHTCNEWKKCLSPPGALRGVGRVDAIRDILKSWRADIAPPLYDARGRRLLAAEPDPNNCRNPWLSDPESWDCACHETITETCEQRERARNEARDRCRLKYLPSARHRCLRENPPLNFEACYQGMLCHPSSPVCQSWKSAVCPSQKNGEEDTLTALLSAEAQADVGWNCG